MADIPDPLTIDLAQVDSVVLRRLIAEGHKEA
jgi:hypothetical protein